LRQAGKGKGGEGEEGENEMRGLGYDDDDCGGGSGGGIKHQKYYQLGLLPIPKVINVHNGLTAMVMMLMEGVREGVEMITHNKRSNSRSKSKISSSSSKSRSSSSNGSTHYGSRCST